MKSKKTILLILIVLASLIPKVGALTPQEQTIHITDTHDDAFITEIGVKIDSILCHVKDPNMDLHAFLVFRELKVNWWEPLENATLRLRTVSPLSFDADSSITIYGMKMAEIQDLGWLTPSDVLSVGYTSAYVTYNTSQFYGSQWWEINVTDIVEELIRNPRWDGDGHDGTETGDAIAFHILGVEGYEKRYFTDFKAGDGYEAQLVIHWNHEPPPPAGYEDAEYNGTYRGYHIWNYTVSYGMNFNWVNFTDWSVEDPMNVITVVNSTHLDGYSKNLIHNGKTGYSILYNTSVENWGTRTFSWKLHHLDDGGANDEPFVGLWSIAKTGAAPGPLKNYGDANEAIAGFCIFDYDPQTDDYYKIGFWIYEDSSLSFPGKFSMPIPASSQQLWTHIEWNMSADLPYVQAWTFNNSAMTSEYLLIFHDLTDSDYWPTPPTSYNQEFLFQTTYYMTTDYSYGNLTMISYAPDDPDIPTSEDEIIWIITDENGTTIDDDLDDYEETIIVIDEILGADPEDPDPPAEGWAEEGPFTRFRTRFYFLIMGLFMLFGPLFTFAYRRPSGYAFVIGLFIMLVGFSFLIHVGSV